MKKNKIILFSFLIVVIHGFSQSNLLLNSGFEYGSPSPSGYQQFDNVEQWKDRYGGSVCGDEPWHSPDWFKVGSFLHEGLPHNGNCHAGFTNYEVIYQKLNNNLIGGTEYTLTMWIKLSTKFPGNAPTQWGNSTLKLYLATGDFEYVKEEGNCNNQTTIDAFCSEDYKIFKSGLSNLDVKEYTIVSSFSNYSVGQWHQVYLTFTAPNKFEGLWNYEWLGIQLTKNSGCREGYLLIDDVQLFIGEICCPDHQIYTNTSKLPSLTQVENYIEAGENLGSFTPNGPVIITAGQSVVFQAGKKIVLDAGFIVQGNFTARIEDCDASVDPDAIKILGSLDNTWTGCPCNTYYCINVSGATSYKCQVFNRFGNNIYDNSGGITSSYTCIWDGSYNGSCTWPSSEVVVIQFWLYDDCGKENFYKIEVNGIPLNCKTANPDSSNSDNSNTKSKGTNNIVGTSGTSQPAVGNPQSDILNSQLKLYPNPNNGSMQMDYRLQEGENGELIIYDVTGRRIKRLLLTSQNNTLKINDTELKDGMYLYHVILNGEIKFSEKLVIIK